jgi:polysaccharide export outer membrane protein
MNTLMMKKHLPLFCMLITLSACSGAPRLTSEMPHPDPIKINSSLEEMVVGPGDVLVVKYFYWPEMNVTQEVRQDGKISLDLIDDIVVAGLTIEEIDQRLTELYEDKLRDPEITVILQQQNVKEVTVGGRVNDPGTVQFKDRLSLTEAIFKAGGMDYDNANLTNIVVMRTRDNVQYATSVDFEEIVTSSVNRPYLLEDGDVVYVTQSGISRANQIVDQYINKMVPTSIVTPAAFFFR